MGTIPLRPTSGLDDPQQKRRDRETINDILTFRADDWRKRTAAEISAGITPTNFAYQPGDVRRYGAAGDNSTDDTQALIRAGQSSKSVYIDSSLTCRVTGTLSSALQSGQRWYGGGQITTANGFNFSVFSASGITDLTIDGLVAASGTLGVSYSTATARFVELTASSHRGRVINCKVTGFQQGVRVHTSTDCKIDNNDFIAPYGWGVSVQTDADDCKVTNNRISGVVNEHGIYVSGASGNLIRAPHLRGNTVSGCAVDGIKLTYCDDAIVSDNTSFSNTGQGIYLTIGVNRAKVHDNTSYSNGEQGVLVFTSTASDTMDRNHIHHNTIYLNDQDGIRVQTGNASATISNTIVSDNIIHDNNQEAGSFRGVSLSLSSGTNTGTQVLRNFITSEGTAINIGASVASTIVQDNLFASNTTNISDAGSGTIINQVTRGATASVADGGTVTHGHVKTPTSVRVTPSVSGEMVSVTAIGATTFTVAIIQDDGTAGTSQTLYWEVSG